MYKNEKYKKNDKLFLYQVWIISWNRWCSKSSKKSIKTINLFLHYSRDVFMHLFLEQINYLFQKCPKKLSAFFMLLR